MTLIRIGGRVFISLEWSKDISKLFYPGDVLVENLILSDVNGDGITDIIWMGEHNIIPYMIVFNGSNGAILFNISAWDLPNSKVPDMAYECLIYDINNDGVNEIIVGYGIEDPHICAFNIFGIVWSINLAEIFRNEYNLSRCSMYAFTPTIGDVNSDGYKEIIIVCWEELHKSLYIVFLKGNGALYGILNLTSILRKWLPQRIPPWDLADLYLLVEDIEDINHDGIVEIAVIDTWAKMAFIISPNGDILRQYSLPCVPLFGIRVRDVNSDGFYDFIIMDDTSSRISLIDGKTGEMLWTINFKNMSPPIVMDTFDFRIADINNDGYAEIIGFGYTKWEKVSRPTLFVIDSRDGRILWKVDTGRVDWVKGFIVFDLNGNGIKDIIIWCGSRIHAYEGSIGEWILKLNVGSNWNTHVAVGDVDGDSVIEIVVASWYHLDVYEVQKPNIF